MKQKRLERKYNKDDLISQMMNFDLIYRKVLLQNDVKSNSKKTYHECYHAKERFQTYQKLAQSTDHS